MRTIAILPVKSFAAAKQRLAGQLGAGSRQALAQAMFSDVLSSLRHVPGLDAVVVVTADRVAEAAARGERVQVLRDTEQQGQSQAAAIGIRYALAADYHRVLLVPGDTPLLDPLEVAGLLAQRSPLAIVPDRHGTGTNALLISPPDAIAPSFGPDSFARHVEAARAAGVEAAVERLSTLMLDVDTPDDLAELATALESRRGHAPSTRGALRQLDRSRARASATRAAPAPAA
ncbi:MAG TPA: 2-phospho-L-lactate guanylyltransferase [Thermoleophilaceae bacterium]|jgi:2-phospho-L-lactate/phosphoenolpyruvate guanylyltransferase|nr:2-phospho-L-lactate guanylyltransferase [Thermoleophilaceae bacterium]